MKNLKMFAITLLAMLVMVSGVRAAEENPCKDAGDNSKVYAKINGTGACYKDISAVLTAANPDEEGGAEEGSTVEITLYEAVASETAALKLSEGVNYTIDLNGKDLTLADKVITVASNQTLTIKGKGKVTATTAIITIGAETEGAKVNIEKDVTLNVTEGSEAIVIAGANELTLAGTLDQDATGKDAIKVTGGDESPIVNVSGNIDSEEGNGITVTGLATINVTGGTIKAPTSTKFAVALSTEDEEQLPVLKISGGEMTVHKDSAAVSITGNYAKDILDANKGNVTGGKFNYGLVKGIKVNGGDMTVADILAILVGNADFEVAKNGTVTVTPKTTQEPEQQPGTTEPGTTGDGNQGGTDNVQNPNTNDNILVYAGLGLVSLASVAFTAKKRED